MALNIWYPHCLYVNWKEPLQYILRNVLLLLDSLGSFRTHTVMWTAHLLTRWPCDLLCCYNSILFHRTGPNRPDHYIVWQSINEIAVTYLAWSSMGLIDLYSWQMSVATDKMDCPHDHKHYIYATDLTYWCSCISSFAFRCLKLVAINYQGLC